jgi:hypothetical protein
MIDDLEELYRTRRPQFSRAAAAIAGDPALGEDAVQRLSPRPCENVEAIAVEVRSRPGSGGS